MFMVLQRNGNDIVKYLQIIALLMHSTTIQPEWIHKDALQYELVILRSKDNNNNNNNRVHSYGEKSRKYPDIKLEERSSFLQLCSIPNQTRQLPWKSSKSSFFFVVRSLSIAPVYSGFESTVSGVTSYTFACDNDVNTLAPQRMHMEKKSPCECRSQCETMSK